MKRFDYRHMQLWPGGRCVDVRGEGDNLKIRSDRKRWRKATAADRRAIRVEELAEAYVERDILCFDSFLVIDMLQNSGVMEREQAHEWEYDNIVNLYPDADNWSFEQCQEWLDDHGYSVEVCGDEDTKLELIREGVKENASAAEIYEWWRVSNWLGDKLKAIGECVLDNNYGVWWGRCCTGQSMIMDGTLQKVAEEFV